MNILFIFAFLELNMDNVCFKLCFISLNYLSEMYLYCCSWLSSIHFHCCITLRKIPHIIFPFYSYWKFAISNIVDKNILIHVCLCTYIQLENIVAVVQLQSHVRLYATPINCSTPGFSVLLLSPGVCPNSCPLSWWCYLIILSSATLFPFCFQTFPASGTFPKSQLFTSGGKIIGAAASVPPVNI